MKNTLRNLFAPILNIFETGDEEFRYKESHRTILLVIGTLFVLLSFLSLAAAIFTAQLAAGLPFLVFFSVGSVCLIVGGLGTDQAVARLWRNK